MTALNLNDTVSVTLSVVGRGRLAAYYAELRAGVPKAAHHHLQPPEAKPDGTHHFQLWQLFAVFGADCGNGRIFPFEEGEVRQVVARPQVAPERPAVSVFDLSRACPRCGK